MSARATATYRRATVWMLLSLVLLDPLLTLFTGAPLYPALG